MATAARNPEVWAKTRYFPIQKHWRKLGPIFRSKEAEAVWRPCMEDYDTQCRYDLAKARGEKCLALEHPPAIILPCHLDGCDWRLRFTGKEPAYWDYVCMRACHWVVDLALYVAKTAYPDVPWRIISSQRHSTVWNGSVDDLVLFDLNFYAIGTPAKEAIKFASRGRELKVGAWKQWYCYPRKHEIPIAA